MKTETIELYLDECGVAPGPWEVEIPDEDWIQINGINRAMHSPEWANSDEWENDLANSHVMAASREMLVALILGALAFENMRVFEDRDYYTRIIESALPGRTWPEIKARLEEIEEEEK